MITNTGLNHMLNVTLNAATQVTTWYVGLIRDDNYTGLAVGDTIASHAGWEEATEYSETVRQTYVEVAATAQLVENTTDLTFTVSSAQTFKGYFVVSDSAKSGVAGTLLATALFADGDRTMAANQLLKVTVIFTAADATV